MLVAQIGYTIRASSMACSRAIGIIGNGIRLGVAEGSNHVSLFFSRSGWKKITKDIQYELQNNYCLASATGANPKTCVLRTGFAKGFYFLLPVKLHPLPHQTIGKQTIAPVPA